MQSTDNATGEIKKLAHRLQELRDAMLQTQQELMERWYPRLHHRHYLPSAANLAAYIGLRRHARPPGRSADSTPAAPTFR